MKKFYYFRGNSEGGLWEMIQGQKHRGDQRVHLSASYRERDNLYRIYNFIDERVVTTLATLSKYGAHKVVLLPDNIIDDLKSYTKCFPSKVCWFFEKHPVYVDFEWEWEFGKKLIGRVTKTWSFVTPKYHVYLIYNGVPSDSLQIVGFPNDLVNCLLNFIFKVTEDCSVSGIRKLLENIENLKSEVAVMNSVPNDEEAEKILDEMKKRK